MKPTRKRLRKLESSVGAGDEGSIRIEFYDISPDGEEIRWPNRPPYNPSAKRVLRVRFDFSDASPEEWKERLAEHAQNAEIERQTADRKIRSKKPSGRHPD